MRTLHTVLSSTPFAWIAPCPGSTGFANTGERVAFDT